MVREAGVRSTLKYALARLGELNEYSLRRTYLLTGCGGSGSTYSYWLLNDNGVAVIHDRRLGRAGIVTNACDGKFVSIYGYGEHGEPEHIFCKVSIREFAQGPLRVARAPASDSTGVLHGKALDRQRRK